MKRCYAEIADKMWMNYCPKTSQKLLRVTCIVMCFESLHHARPTACLHLFELLHHFLTRAKD